MTLASPVNISHLAISRHVQNYLDQLSTGQEIPLVGLTESYLNLKSVLHPKASSAEIDFDALKYSLPRLPEEICNVKKIYLLQNKNDLSHLGFDTNGWKITSAVARRRLIYINPTLDTLAVILSSDSDIHDLLNCLLSFYIEKEKIKKLPQNSFLTQFQTLLGPDWQKKLDCIYKTPDLTLQLFNHQDLPYWQNSQSWLSNFINQAMIVEPQKVPVYFVSSNAHNLVNLISGFLHQKQNYIFDHISHSHPALYQQWFDVKTRQASDRVNDFLYYVARLFLRQHPEFVVEKNSYEAKLGIKIITSDDAFQAKSQVIPLKSLLLSQGPDSSLKFDPQILSQSRAIIVNVEYPLGLAAYHLLNSIISTFHQLRSIYIMGKAAILKGNIGDIQIPTLVHDEHSDNDYLFTNVFNHSSLFSNLTSSVFPDQKAVSVYGTYLENSDTINNYLQSGINIVEMESGPYLRSITEKFVLGGNEIAKNFSYDLRQIPLDLGIINYASDNPLVQTLAKEGLAVEGIEPVYLASRAILQRIINLEQQRLSP